MNLLLHLVVRFSIKCCLFRGTVVQGDGSIIRKENWRISGNTSEGAMIKLAQYLLEDNPLIFDSVDDTRKTNPTIFQIPFNSRNKYQVSVNVVEGGHHVVLMKGAPERIIGRCDSALIGGHVILLTPQQRESIER